MPSFEIAMALVIGSISRNCSKAEEKHSKVKKCEDVVVEVGFIARMFRNKEGGIR